VILSRYSGFFHNFGRHDIDEILLKVALSTINQSINITQYYPTAEAFDYHVQVIL
jgi:hypothetical protein